MPDKQKKRTRPKTGINTKHIQATLNRKYFREGIALEAYDKLVAKNTDWNERAIITESLIALGEKVVKGFKAPDMPDEVRISSELLLAFDRLSAFANMIANMDITQLRQVQGFDETVYEGMKAEGLRKGAARMLSDDTEFQDDDWS